MGNAAQSVEGVNLFNADRPLMVAHDGSSVRFHTVTTGNFAGFDLRLDDAQAGELDIVSNIVNVAVPLAEIGFEDYIIDLGGLGRRIRIFRIPEEDWSTRVSGQHTVPLCEGRDNPIYVRLTQEDGHQAWTSPIYVIE